MQVGDKIVCANNIWSYKLKLYNVYIISEITYDDDNIRYIRVNNISYRYPLSMFINLKKHRKQKLEKINLCSK